MREGSLKSLNKLHEAKDERERAVFNLLLLARKKLGKWLLIRVGWRLFGEILFTLSQYTFYTKLSLLFQNGVLARTMF